MEARERENDARRARNGPLLPMDDKWVERPVLNNAEQVLFGDFLLFAQFCGGDPRPADALAWFDMRGVPQSERGWMAAIFSSMSAPLRERPEEPS